MAFINKEPNSGTINGEERYYCWASQIAVDLRIFIYKIKVLRKRYDQVNSKSSWDCEVLRTVLGEERNGLKFIVDYVWQLQRTEEDAKRLLILGIMSGKETFYSDVAPWK